MFGMVLQKVRIDGFAKQAKELSEMSAFWPLVQKVAGMVLRS